MPRYSARWLELAAEQYASLPADTQRHVNRRVGELLDQPEGPRSDYDRPSDTWTTTYGDGIGLLLYAVVPEHNRLLILRLV